MRVLIVQYEGDYRAAYHLHRETGEEKYYGHRYVIQQLERINAELGVTAILCCKSEEAYSETLPSGLTLMGAGAGKAWDGKKVLDMVKAYDPTHLIVLGPLTRFIRWGLRNGRNVSCIFADSFEISFFRRLVRYGRLTTLLTDDRVEWIANHGIASCMSLANLGVSRDKIIPWDWPYSRQPDDLEPKVHTDSGQSYIMFAGTVSERKGVGDLIRALEILTRQGMPVRAKIAGSGDVDRYTQMATRSGLDVEFLGRVTNAEVFRLMREAAIVVVPSQHAYPEGLPLTIYEALCARTPIVASDHPMFLGNLEAGKTAMIFKAGRPEDMANAVKALLQDPATYSALSTNSQKAWEHIQVQTKWGEMLYRMLSGQNGDLSWLKERCLASDLYVARLSAWQQHERSQSRGGR